jgi:dTDP-4-amino-4,6-dideoxygalactose transaminase
MGLAVFPSIDLILSARKTVVEYYNENLDFSNLKSIKIRQNTTWNYSYYPVIFESEPILLKVQETLNQNQIFPRRYFYPSLNTIDYSHGQSMPISESIASRILCLPLYVGLEKPELEQIVNLINKTIC